jgi:hypothetical protein
MKSVIVEVKGNRAVALNDSGDFTQVRNRHYKVGQRLEGRARPAGGFMKMAAAAASFLVLAAGGAIAYCMPYTQVTMDVNPSIELDLNIFNRVVGTTAFNDDAAGILERLHLFNADLSTAASEIVDELIDQGYIQPGAEADIMVTACSGDQTRSQDRLRDAVRAVEQKTAELRVNANVYGECVNAEIRNRARELGVSPGKLRLAEQYAASTGKPGDVNLKDWLDKPVREIVAAMHKNGAAPGDGNGNGYLGGDQSGNGYNGGDDNATGTPGLSPSPASSPNGGGRNGNGWNTATAAPDATPVASPCPSCTCSPTGTGDMNRNRNGNGGNN